MNTKGHAMFKSAIAISVALVMTGCVFMVEQQLDHEFSEYMLFGPLDDDAVAILIVSNPQQDRYSAMVTYNGGQRQSVLKVEVWELLDEDLVLVEDVDVTALLERIRGVVQAVDDNFLPVFINTLSSDANLSAALKGLAEELVGAVAISENFDHLRLQVAPET